MPPKTIIVDSYFAKLESEKGAPFVSNYLKKDKREKEYNSDWTVSTSEGTTRKLNRELGVNYLKPI